jgi:hypothetical protein
MPVKTGTVWPVRVDRANPSRLKFLWDRVQGAAAPAAAPVITRSVQTFSLPPSIQVMGGSMEQAKQAIEMAEQAMGMDLDGDGKVAGAGAAAARADEDPVSKLERLAKLLDAGDITREEFDAQKKRILGSTS